MPDNQSFYAHTPPDGEPNKWQSMLDHTSNVAAMAAEFARPFQAEELARWAGWLHDIGKFSKEFQDYLRRCHQDKLAGKKGKTRPGGGDHKEAGARLSHQVFKGNKINPLSMVALGHHGGLPDATDVKGKPADSATETQLDSVIATAREHLPLLNSLPASLPFPTAAGLNSKEPYQMEMFFRMLFSCLVDADSLDTENHFQPDRDAKREWTASLHEWEQRLRTDQDRLQEQAAQRATNERDLARTVNRVRREVYTDCLNAAQKPQGAFRLTVPTGGGKTRASLAFALAHANRMEPPLERIIYAIPYTSIIDQTAQEFRKILGNDAPLLVHHSALPEDDEEDQGDGESSWRRLASQNWDAPLIVTTTVQLFESLFSNRPGRCRKLHHLARSVIILDEVQTLPIPLLKPILDTLRTLVNHYGVTVVFCTATQPAFEIMASHLRGFKRIEDIVQEPARHFRDMVRVRYNVQAEKWDWKRVAEEMRRDGQTQCLAVVNTRADALKLLNALDDPDALHLSTLLCGAHREAALEDIRARLKAGQPCRLVSTQVIEAGVDVDFPRVLRAIGPFDRIIQAAGRCNREGKREFGEVVVFFPSEGGMPPDEYRTATEEAKILLARGKVDFHSPEVCTAYFETLYKNITTDKHEIQNLRKTLNYPKVAEAFRMIDSPTKPVLVCYEPEKERYSEIVAVARAGRMTRKQWQRAQPLLVNLFDHDITAQLKIGMLEDALPQSSGALYIWKGEYDQVRGMVGITRDPVDPVYDPGELIP